MSRPLSPSANSLRPRKTRSGLNIKKAQPAQRVEKIAQTAQRVEKIAQTARRDLKPQNLINFLYNFYLVGLRPLLVGLF
jgi:hypothetical protein